MFANVVSQPPRPGHELVMDLLSTDDAPVCVVIANDQEWSARSLESVLTPLGCRIERAFTGTQALHLARRGRPDLVFLDAQMSDLHGVEVCRRLRADPRVSAAMPILVTTSGPSGRAERLAALQAGAWEFIPEPIDIQLLLPKLLNFVAAKRAADRWRDASLLDAATGLYNARGLERRAGEILAEATRRRAGVACAVFVAERSADPMEADLSLGRLLRQEGRSSDAIARLDTSAFAVVAPASETTDGARLAERLGSRMRTGITEGVELRAAYGTLGSAQTSGLDGDQIVRRATTAVEALRGLHENERPAIFSLS